MDTRFFRSKQFVISAAIALALVGTAAGAYLVGGVSTSVFSQGCTEPRSDGTPISAPPRMVIEDGGRARDVKYQLDAQSFTGGAMDICVAVGEVLIEPSAGTNVELTFRIRGDTAGAVAETLVDARFYDDAGRLRMTAWESQVGKANGVFGRDSADIALIIRVPPSGAYAIKAMTDVGDIGINDLLLDSVDAKTDVGNVHVFDVDLQGDAAIRTDVGDVILEARSVQTGRITAHADVGNAEVLLPRRVDVGYDATGTTSVGNVEIQLGDTETYESRGSVPGERETARTSDYASKPTQVVIVVETDVGDVRIITSTPVQNGG